MLLYITNMLGQKMEDIRLKPIEKLPPITREDRMKKMEYDAHAEGPHMDLGEDVELKETLAKKFHWMPAKKPLVRLLMRNGSIILYKDIFYHYMMDAEQAKDYGNYEELVENERKNVC